MSSQRAKPRGSTSNIFINYRREDSSGHAGRLFDALNAHFAGRLFMDIDTLEPGVDFVEAIEKAVGSCEVLLVLIGREWLAIKNAAGRRRLDDPGDFVRLELESALARKIRIIPVLVQGAPMPSTEELPPSLAALARRNAIELSDARWAYDVDRLAHTIQEILEEKGAVAPAETSSSVRPRIWLLALAVLALIATVALAAFLWPRQAPQPVARPAELGNGITAPARDATPASPVDATPAVSSTSTAESPSVPPRREAPRVEAPHASESPRQAERTAPVTRPSRKVVEIPVGQPAEPARGAAVHSPPKDEKSAAVATAPPRATITAPAQGARVGSTVQVQGTITDLGDRRVFLCIRQGNGSIYPRGELFPKADGQWSIQLRSSKEKSFDILLVTSSNKPASQLLSDQKSRDDGIPVLPQGAAISSGIVTVRRQGKIRDMFDPN